MADTLSRPNEPTVSNVGQSCPANGYRQETCPANEYRQETTHTRQEQPSVSSEMDGSAVDSEKIRQLVSSASSTLKDHDEPLDGDALPSPVFLDTSEGGAGPQKVSSESVQPSAHAARRCAVREKDYFWRIFTQIRKRYRGNSSSVFSSSSLG